MEKQINGANTSQRIPSNSGQPELKILHFAAKESSKPNPLLFIHGYSAGAWMFAENYANLFSDRGYDVFALNLRGHGQSEGRETVADASLEDYFQDVVRAVSFIKSLTQADPILIGHSMGSILTRLYLQNYKLPGAILMSFGDIKTAFPAFMMWSMTNFPLKSWSMMISGRSDKMYSHFEPHFQLLFTETDSRQKLKPFVQKCMEQPESDRVFTDIQKLEAIGQKRGNTPMAIIAGDRDPIAPKKSIATLGNFYQTEPIFIPHKAHDLFIGDGWETAANEILIWLEQNNL